MIDFNLIRGLRTKGKLINYFKHLNKNITEDKITALKQNCGKLQGNEATLTMKQLDNISGGNLTCKLSLKFLEKVNELSKVNPGLVKFEVKGKKYIKLTLIMDEIYEEEIDLSIKPETILSERLGNLKLLKGYCLQVYDSTYGFGRSQCFLPEVDKSESLDSLSGKTISSKSMENLSKVRMPYFLPSRESTIQEDMRGSESGTSSDASPNSSSLASSDR